MVLKVSRQIGEVQEFKFGSLAPLSEDFGKSAKSFEFDSLNNLSKFKNSISDIDLAIENENAHKIPGFQLDQKVRDSRGLGDIEKQEILKKVDQEVEIKLSQMQEKSKEIGFKDGFASGYKEAFIEAQEIFQDELARVSGWIEEIQNERENLIKSSKKVLLNQTLNLCQWILMKEMNDKNYLERLMEKLLHEISNRENLVFRVNENSLDHLKALVPDMEKKIGVLKNVRFEIDSNISERGMIVESPQLVIDGSFEYQMELLSKMFSSLVNEVDKSEISKNEQS